MPGYVYQDIYEALKPGVAPELGAHNDAVLGDLGYSQAEVADLRARRII